MRCNARGIFMHIGSDEHMGGGVGKDWRGPLGGSYDAIAAGERQFAYHHWSLARAALPFPPRGGVCREWGECSSRFCAVRSCFPRPSMYIPIICQVGTQKKKKVHVCTWIWRVDC